MTFALPDGYTISIMKPVNSILQFMRRMVPRWHGSQVEVVIAHANVRLVGQGREPPFIRYIRLSDGWLVGAPRLWMMPPRQVARTAKRRSRVLGVIDPITAGYAIVWFRRTGWNRDINTHIPKVYLHAFTSDPAVQVELDVARDAYQAGDGNRAICIAQRALPENAALYMTVVRHEFEYLQRETKAAQ